MRPAGWRVHRKSFQVYLMQHQSDNRPLFYQKRCIFLFSALLIIPVHWANSTFKALLKINKNMFSEVLCRETSSGLGWKHSYISIKFHQGSFLSQKFNLAWAQQHPPLTPLLLAPWISWLSFKVTALQIVAIPKSFANLLFIKICKQRIPSSSLQGSPSSTKMTLWFFFFHEPPPTPFLLSCWIHSQ